jgi:RNA polymerase sigma factor (sigma-70 family)
MPATQPPRDHAIPFRDARVLVDVRRAGVPVDRLPDETLLYGLVTGDAEITIAFLRRFQRLVYGIALTVVGDPGVAEDVAQQTFERAWRHAQVFDPRRGSVRTWLATIARNLAIDAVRKHQPAPLAPEDLAPLLTAVTSGPEQAALASEATAELRRAVASLPPEQARALVLAGIHGMTAREISEWEGVPLGTAKTRIRSGMLKVRAWMSGERADHE